MRDRLTIYILRIDWCAVPTRTRAAASDQEAYNVIIATSKVIRHVAQGLFAGEGITEPQFLALLLLMENGPMVMRNMSDEMLVTPANVTGIVDRLEEKRLVRRASVKGDRRATIIEITAEGKALYERVAVKKAAMVGKALATFTSDELMTLHGLLERFQSEMSRSIGDR
jgi:DNA-binding MarR family transcriptional regulator